MCVCVCVCVAWFRGCMGRMCMHPWDGRASSPHVPPPYTWVCRASFSTCALHFSLLPVPSPASSPPRPSPLPPGPLLSSPRTRLSNRHAVPPCPATTPGPTASSSGCTGRGMAARASPAASTVPSSWRSASPPSSVRACVRACVSACVHACMRVHMCVRARACVCVCRLAAPARALQEEWRGEEWRGGGGDGGREGDGREGRGRLSFCSAQSSLLPSSL